MTNAMATTRLLRDREIVNFIDQWQALALRTASPNLFYEPWMLWPAVERGLCDGAIEWLVIERGGRWDALFPLARHRFAPTPLAVLRPLLHPYCCSSLPLVAAGAEAEVARLFATWLRAQPTVLWLEWPRIPSDTAVFAALFAPTAPLRIREDAGYTRALHIPGEDAATLSTKHRQNYRRLEKKLANDGGLDFEVITDRVRGDAWLAEFLRLEERGWKGQEGSALACQPATRAFFLETMHAGLTLGRVELLALVHQGERIAMKTQLHDRDMVYTWKVAFDERFAKSSPGALLELSAIRHGDTAARLPMDSAGVEHNEPFDRLYNARRPIARLIVDTGAPTATMALAARTLEHRVRRMARTARNFFVRRSL